MASPLDTLTDERAKEIANNLLQGGTFRELKGVSDEELETIYATGAEYYKGGNFADAAKIFRFLAFLEHTNSRFLTAYGSALQAQNKYAEAIKCYQQGSFLDLHNPKPVYYAAECFVKIGDIENARRALTSLDMFAPRDTEVGRRFLAKGKELLAKIEAA